jgi:hypothetical protein
VGGLSSQRPGTFVGVAVAVATGAAAVAVAATVDATVGTTVAEAVTVVTAWVVLLAVLLSGVAEATLSELEIVVPAAVPAGTTVTMEKVAGAPTFALSNHRCCQQLG